MPVTTFLFCIPIPPFVITGMCFDSAVSRLKGEGRRYIHFLTWFICITGPHLFLLLDIFGMAFWTLSFLDTWHEMCSSIGLFRWPRVYER